MTNCPYCDSKLKEVSREENLNARYQPSIGVVFQCPSCKKEPMMMLEFEGWYDGDDNPIEYPSTKGGEHR